MIKFKNLSLIPIIFIWLVILAPFSLAQEEKPAISGFFSLRNDDQINLMRPIGSAPEKAAEAEKAKPAEKIVPKVGLAKPLPAEEKKIPAEGKEVKERIPLRFDEEAEALPQITPRIERKREVAEPVAPAEKPEFYLRLSPKKEALPRVVPYVSKPEPTPSKPKPEIKPSRPKTALPATPALVPAEVKTVQEIVTPPSPIAPVPVKKEKAKFSFASLSPILRWGIVLSGIATLLLVIIVIYLLRQKELSLPELEEGVPPSESGRYKSLSRDIRDLRVGYKGIEKTVDDMEKKMSLLSPLKGTMIDEFTRKTSKEVFKPVENGVSSLQGLCEGLEKMLAEFDTRLGPLDALKGLSIKDLAQQTTMELYRPLENEFKKMKASYEHLIGEFEERLDRKVDGIVKRNKGLEKVMGEIDSRLAMMDSIIASLSQAEEGGGGMFRGGKKPPEANKVIEVKQKRERETLHNQIYKMSDEGLSVDEIAQRTKMGKGEVRLILGLRRK